MNELPHAMQIVGLCSTRRRALLRLLREQQAKADADEIATLRGKLAALQNRKPCKATP
jgi:hypothetical protein